MERKLERQVWFGFRFAALKFGSVMLGTAYSPSINRNCIEFCREMRAGG
jgi:hypothetical protein